MITLIDVDAYVLHAEIDKGVAFLHMDYKFEKFTKSIYKELLIQFELILEELKSNGIKAVASIIPENWGKVRKWQEMFGLIPTYTIEDKILFRREL